MKPIKHNIGAQLKLPVERVVAIKGRKTYIVRYEDSLCRVQMFDWQEDQPTPKNIYCRFKKNRIKYIDYKDADFLLRFVNEQGKLLPRRITG